MQMMFLYFNEFLSKAKVIPNIIKQFNKNTFTNKALAGIRGIEKGTSQEFFERLTNNVFTVWRSKSYRSISTIVRS